MQTQGAPTNLRIAQAERDPCLRRARDRAASQRPLGRYAGPLDASLPSSTSGASRCNGAKHSLPDMPLAEAASTLLAPMDRPMLNTALVLSLVGLSIAGAPRPAVDGRGFSPACQEGPRRSRGVGNSNSIVFAESSPR